MIEKSNGFFGKNWIFALDFLSKTRSPTEMAKSANKTTHAYHTTIFITDPL